MNRITYLTRALVLLIVELHCNALIAGAKRKDAAAERKADAADRQIDVVAWAQRDLADKRAAALDASREANQEWQRVNAEIDRLPRF